MARYRKKPVVIEAFRFGIDEPERWWKTAVDVGIDRVVTPVPGDGPQYAIINTLEGDMIARYGDWIIRGVRGELYPCKPDIFDATYEPASPPPDTGG